MNIFSYFSYYSPKDSWRPDMVVAGMLYALQPTPGEPRRKEVMDHL